VGTHALYGQVPQSDVVGLVTDLSGKAALGHGHLVPNPPVAVSYASTITLNAALGSLFRVTATGNPSFAAPSNPTDGQVIVVEFTASGADRTASLVQGSAGAWKFGTDVTALTATTSGLTDFWQAVYRASVDRWRVIGYVKGY
jgi:hypothetical protein